jgi:ubiquinone/menaquinone biosynthesis C-methylase UbiE
MLDTFRSVIEALRTLPIRREWKILDVGCGSGGSLLQFLGLGFSPRCLYGIDICPERIQEGKEKFPNINFVCGDAARMDYETNYFDMAMESTMFIQLTDDDLARRIADEMLRVVKPSGNVVLIDWRYSYGHPEYKALSRKRIIELFQVGTQTTAYCSKHGALIPPLGRLLSAYLPSSYFMVQRLLPFLSGQMVTVLQKAVYRCSTVVK